MRITSIIAVAGALVAAQPAFAANLVTNGSFENGLSGWGTFGGGVTPGQGIKVIETGVPNGTGYGDFVPVKDGTHAAYFVDDKAFENLFQKVSLVAGTKYTLSYSLFATESGANNPFGFLLTDTLGLHLVDIVSSNTVAVGQWTDYSFSYIAPATKDYLLNFNFISGKTPAKDVLLDAVNLSSAVPETSTWAMMILGLGAVGGALRRRRQSVSYNFA